MLFDTEISITPKDVQQQLDERWMREALTAARAAGERGEVPVGTCVIIGSELLAVAGSGKPSSFRSA